MPCWHDNMTAEDHDRNSQDYRDETRRELIHAKVRARMVRHEIERLEAAFKTPDKEPNYGAG